MEFRERLRELRESENLSAATLASKFNKSESAIRMWELGRSKPDAETIIALSKYFKCSTDYLLGLTNKKNMGTVTINNQSLQNLDELLANSPDSLFAITSINGILADLQTLNNPHLFTYFTNALVSLSNLTFDTSHLAKLETKYENPDNSLQYFYEFISSENSTFLALIDYFKALLDIHQKSLTQFYPPEFAPLIKLMADQINATLSIDKYANKIDSPEYWHEFHKIANQLGANITLKEDGYVE